MWSFLATRIFDYLLMQYKIDNEVHPIDPKVHGNRRHGERTYAKTFKSTIDRIKLCSHEENMAMLAEQRA